MAERYTASSKVAPVLVGRKLDAAVASERLQHLDFDQCHLTIEVVFLGVCPESRRVTVALMPMPATNLASGSASIGAAAFDAT